MGLFAGSPLGIIKHLKDVLTIIRCKVSPFYDRAASSLSADDLLIVAGYLDSSAAGRHGPCWHYHHHQHNQDTLHCCCIVAAPESSLVSSGRWLEKDVPVIWTILVSYLGIMLYVWLPQAWSVVSCLLPGWSRGGILVVTVFVTPRYMSRSVSRDNCHIVTECYLAPSDLVTRPSVSNWVWHLGTDVTTGIRLMSPIPWCLMLVTRASQSPARYQARTRSCAGLNWSIFTAAKLNWAVLSS